MPRTKEERKSKREGNMMILKNSLSIYIYVSHTCVYIHICVCMCVYIYSNGPKLRICFWKRNKSTRRLRFSVAQVFFWLIVTICRVYASKWLFRKFYEYFLDFLVNVGTRGLRTWFGRCCCCFGDLCQSSQFVL